MFSLHKPLEDALREKLKSHDDLTAALLARRGIKTPEEAEAFLSPSYDEHIGDPLQILNMPKAAERISRALADNERIAVWSDYDCDGIPGGALLHDFFKKAKANFTNYIPHRHLEGFGLNTSGLDSLKEDGVSLVITVDCGIADVAEVAYANELGMDVIITDHHLPGDVLPPAYAIVDPKQDGETYLFRDFCGGGLAWKLACAVLAVGFPGREEIPLGWEKWLLDMAALSTIADMVPLLGENRVIAKYGLFVMRKSPRLGLQRLCRVARVNQRKITEDDVGFMIAPRVNAASRMGDPRDAFELFTTTDESRADELAKKLEQVNRSRRAQGAAVTRAVHERLTALKEKGEIPPVIVMGDPNWRPGLLGLVANSVAEEYQRPVFLWGREGGTTLKGSCRAGGKGVSLVALMQLAGDVFAESGGHAASGGFTVRDEGIFELEARLCAALAALPPVADADSIVYADAELLAAEAPLTHLGRVERLAPFGMGNPKPSYVVRDANLQKVSWFGKGEEHLRLTLTRTDGFETATMEAISFYAKRGLGERCMELTAGSTITLLGTLERDQFSRGQPARLRILAVGA
ncbi:MAG TPA: single-stranded-DNA-specific exonuclease RecJ [Candidatus Paceibacterota bacterium]|jgi:single-stranded-DNA-specific exonuclease